MLVYIACLLDEFLPTYLTLKLTYFPLRGVDVGGFFITLIHSIRNFVVAVPLTSRLVKNYAYFIILTARVPSKKLANN